MDLEDLRQLFQTCYEARQIKSLMPMLPQGFKPRYLNIIEIIGSYQKNNITPKISDVSQSLSITTPSVTKLINELETMQILTKNNSIQDKRVVEVSLTSMGEEYYQTYIENFKKIIAAKMTDVSSEDVATTKKTIHRLFEEITDFSSGNLKEEIIRD